MANVKFVRVYIFVQIANSFSSTKKQLVEFKLGHAKMAMSRDDMIRDKNFRQKILLCKGTCVGKWLPLAFQTIEVPIYLVLVDKKTP